MWQVFFIIILYVKLESDGILVGMRPFGERDLIATVFSREYGVVSGMIRAGAAKNKNRPLVGQVGNMTWSARLDDQLGAIHWEPSANLIVQMLNNNDALKYFNAMTDLIAKMLPEREQYEQLYTYTINMLREPLDKSKYLKWEILLLRELGYAIDLSHCSGCGAMQDLNYLSPKTCRAVCDKCAQPYLNKLYRLPITLETTYKLLANICEQQGIPIPNMRKLIENIF
ncbi:MAG: DNA repair protein RecO [Proteobacteria bacterium]|nr:DNA repair protein RecO [Candidatus Enterousia scatequi]